MAKKTAKPAASTKSSKKSAAKPVAAPALFHDVSHGDDKIFALLGAALPLVGYVVAVLAKKNSSYVTFYGKQGVVLFILGLISAVVAGVFAFIPVFGQILGLIIWAFVIILWVVGILNALSGEARDSPLIGVYAGKL